MWSPSGPHPLPSLISIVMDRDTTSRDAKSFAVGAYLHTCRCLQRKYSKCWLEVAWNCAANHGLLSAADSNEDNRFVA